MQEHPVVGALMEDDPQSFPALPLKSIIDSAVNFSVSRRDVGVNAGPGWHDPGVVPDPPYLLMPHTPQRRKRLLLALPSRWYLCISIRDQLSELQPSASADEQ